MKGQAVIVTGCFRSGTSLVAGIVNALGVDFGPSELLAKPDKNNPYGYWENSDFSAHNQAILRHSGGTTVTPPCHISIVGSAPCFFQRTEELLRKYETDALWGWKEPTNCLVLDHYLLALRNPLVVVAVRNIHGIVRSAKRSWGWPSAEILPLALTYCEYLCDSLACHSNVDVFYVCYEALVTSPLTSIRGIADFLGYDCDDYTLLDIAQTFNILQRKVVDGTP